jgi:hypothetical protein
MRPDLGHINRQIRAGLAAVIAILYFSNVIPGTWAAVWLVVAFVFALTSLVSFCPLYTLLGVNTCGSSRGRMRVSKKKCPPSCWMTGAWGLESSLLQFHAIRHILPFSENQCRTT